MAPSRREDVLTTGSALPTAASHLWQAPSAALARHDPDWTALHRAVRVTLVACVCFYLCHYVIRNDTTALYALFGAIALGALSEVTGSREQRLRGYAIALAVAVVLVTIGTFVAVNTAAAVAVMLVVGSAIAYSGVTGQRVAGVANGLQLFFVLPCFPPFTPDQLGDRLAGVTLGIVALAIADRYVLPVPDRPDPPLRFRASVEASARFAEVLAAALRAGPSNGPALPDVCTDARAAALDAAEALRLSNVPLPERPLGYGLRDRSLFAVAAASRLVTARTSTLAALLTPEQPHPVTADLLDAAATVLRGTAATLGGGSPPSLAELDATMEVYLQSRVRHLPLTTGPTDDLRAGLAAAAAARAARIAGLAAHGFHGVPPAGELPRELWFLRASAWQLLLHRVTANLTPRSVYLQNAVRVGIGLAVARLLAGVFDLSHGFWVLLATLSLMRTSAVASRSTLVKAFVGTLGGAAVAAAVLTWVPVDVYPWLLPVTMVVAFVAGPLFGVAAGQAGFTIVVSLLFAQLTPSTWQLAEVRLEDVVLGGLVGAVIGAAVWPRGGSGELHRIAAEALRAGADKVVGTIALLARGTRPATTDLHRLADLLDHTYVQSRTEPGEPGPEIDWLATVTVVHRLSTYSATLRERHPDAPALPWPAEADRLTAGADEVAAALRAAADAVAARTPVPAQVVATCRDAVAVHAPRDLADDAEAGLRVLDAWAWLVTVTADLDRVATPPGTTGPASAQATHERSAVKPTDIDGS
ncbi:fusaric acid resistance protein [Pseudonocardia sulfidoxydans NBRC 16205]|uniref:Fusaric acid resistance protein n=1 Tax=Pseudonocardia sulfidoxydans NBRC 16205 TaxID=1223511 RepID=A0A511DB42_9PSEU|nr:FUSC family protein [Pseudonocardia sulfidoxydans]GEL22009.1 fusaric acid resistance protein [Pseudonocardia sulfidoxydans NBRC 16205]